MSTRHLWGLLKRRCHQHSSPRPGHAQSLGVSWLRYAGFALARVSQNQGKKRYTQILQEQKIFLEVGYSRDQDSETLIDPRSCERLDL